MSKNWFLWNLLIFSVCNVKLVYVDVVFLYVLFDLLWCLCWMIILIKVLVYEKMVLVMNWDKLKLILILNINMNYRNYKRIEVIELLKINWIGCYY